MKNTIIYERGGTVVSIVILGLIAVIVVVFITVYNGLVRMRNTVKSAWSDIDVQLKKRFNLVPNLIDTVKGYAKHEKEVFEKVTEARAQALGGGSPKEMGEKDNFFKDTLKSLFAVAEAYPELKANENFIKLQVQFQDIENNIESARRYYNATVRDYNTGIQVFPGVIVANMFNFTPEEFFQLDSPDERQPVRSDFSS